MLDTLLYISAVLFSLLGAIFIFFSLPGLLLIAVVNTILIFYKGVGMHTHALIYTWLGYLIPEGGEFILTYLASRIVKADRFTAIMAIIGGIIGAIVGSAFFYGLGAIPGLMLGSFGAAFIIDLLEKGSLASAFTVGIAVVISKAIVMLLRFTALFFLMYLQWKVMFG